MQRRRLRHHLALATITGTAIVVALIRGPSSLGLDRLSIVTAYLCMGYLCGALLIGPVQAIQSGQPTVNNLLRRDIGIWAAAVGFGHFYLAMILSMGYEYLDLFVYAEGLSLSAELRYLIYSWGTIAGFIVGVLFILLLGLSNNRSLRLFGARWWKRLQRVSYFAFILTVFHGICFQVLESRSWSLVIAITVASVAVLVMQLSGIKCVRQKKRAEAIERSSVRQ